MHNNTNPIPPPGPAIWSSSAARRLDIISRVLAELAEDDKVSVDLDFLRELADRSNNLDEVLLESLLGAVLEAK
jgi:hypothetical protein